MSAIIETFSGNKIDLQFPQTDKISLVDIAHSLSQTCRFGGHSLQFYSVAEHAVRTSYLVPREHALAALHHDSAEAYLCDIPGPLKKILGHYYESLTKEFDFIIDKALGTTYSNKSFQADIVRADDAMLAYEANKLLASKGDWTDKILLKFASSMHNTIDELTNMEFCMSNNKAREHFINRHFELKEEEEWKLMNAT